MEHAHANGFIHRDLKPSNLVLVQETNTEVVKLIDFGIAKNLLEDSALTKTGNVFGTPLYMSPEQCAGKKLDERSDIYSLGCIMYEALAGKPPLSGDNSLDTMQKHLKNAPDQLTKILPASAENHAKLKSLNDVVMKCLEKKPADRYQKVSDLRKDLSSLRQGKQPSPRFALRGRTKQIIAVVTIGIFLSAIGMLVLKVAKTHKSADLQIKESVTAPSSQQDLTLDSESIATAPADSKTENGAKPAPAIGANSDQQSHLPFPQMMDEARSAAKFKNWKVAKEKAQECLIVSNQLGKGPTRTSEIYWHIAQAEYNLREYSSAQRDYKLALDAVSDETDNRSKSWRYQALVGLARIARLNIQYQEAIALYEKAYQTVLATSPQLDDPRSEEKIQKHKAICMQGIGEVYYVLHEFEKCKLYWKASLKIRPDNPDLANNLSKLP
ncbi:MAG: serine/threonine protein kinase [Cyanobacteria bacterium SZAS-4]|nr:serine/threonine protein kinase [Cyanobacteria bacterium SZAS-4]